MNITKEQADKVIAALSMNRIMARDENGNYTKEITAQVVVEALSIMRGLADAEPVAWMHPTSSFSVITQEQKDSNSLQYSDEFLAGHTVPLYTSPQAAQTEGKPIEALAPTEAQEREAFEAFMLTKYPAHLCHWVGDQYSEMFTRLVFVGWKAGRAGSKP